jgi:hypothetical protein
MANPTVRAVAFYWKGRKAAYVNQVNPKFKTGRSALFGAEGYLCHSKGAGMTTFEINEVVPVSGSTTVDDIVQILAQQDVEVQCVLGGKYFTVTCAVMEADYSSDTETGKVTGKIVLEGGVPAIV